jgi:predicted Rossmann fold flavoprotein
MTTRVLVLGGGAAGMIAAREAAHRGREVLVVDQGTLPGRKLAITGGVWCNVSNMEIAAERYLGVNHHFVRSALARFGVWDTISLLGELDIGTEERERGELFCDQRATLLAERLWRRAEAEGATLLRSCRVEGLSMRPGGGFVLSSSRGPIEADAVVVATGGASYPRTGATTVGMDIARGFGIPVLPPRPGLVPLLWRDDDRERFGPLTGNALEVVASCAGSPLFRANMLLTHRGLSGPAILQVSSYWKPGEPVQVDLLPGLDILTTLREARRDRASGTLRNLLAGWLPKRLVAALQERELPRLRLGELSNHQIEAIHQALHSWAVVPGGKAGWDSAEVTLGGVDTRAISSRTMEANAVPGLFFAGEVLDITGWLGGYNLQWAWSSGWVAGRSC